MNKLNSKVVMFELPFLGRLFGLGRMICVGDAEIARHILVTANYNKSPTYSVLQPLIGMSSMVATEGKMWKDQRKLYNPGFSPEFLRNCVSTIIEKCNRFIARCDGDVENGVATDMLARSIDLTSDVIVQVAFGEDWGIDSKDKHGIETLQTIRDLTVAVGENMTNPLRKYFGLRSIWRTRRLSAALDQDMQNLVKRRLAQVLAGDADLEKDILSLTLSGVLEAKQESKSGAISLSKDEMERMTSQLKTFYFAGHDTSSSAIAWAYWLLTKHPESLQRAREEVVLHLGRDWSDEALTGDSLCNTTYQCLQKCEYLDAVARETLRLYPPAASTRWATDAKGANAGGFNLEKSVVHVNFYAIQRDPDVWENPDSFVPERFLGEEGRKRILSYSFLPFSKGSRDCIGKYFALLEIKIALAALISRYDASVVNENEQYVIRLTSVPHDGCKVNLSRRRK